MMLHIIASAWALALRSQAFTWPHQDSCENVSRHVCLLGLCPLHQGLRLELHCLPG